MHGYKKEGAGKIISAGILFAVVSQIVHTVGAVVSMNYYMDPAYISVWSRFMMPTAGPPPTGFYMASVFLALMTGTIYSYIYTIVRRSVCGRGVIDKGVCFGLILFFIATLPGMIALYLLINLPFALVLVWILEGLFINVVGAVGIVRVVG